MAMEKLQNRKGGLDLQIASKDNEAEKEKMSMVGCREVECFLCFDVFLVTFCLFLFG